MDTYDLQARIRAAREKMGLSQQKMADEMGISRTAYRRFESGATPIFGRTFLKFLQTTGMSFEDLLLDPSSQSLLRDSHDSSEWKRQIVAEYENRLAEKDNLLLQKDSLIKAQQGVIDNKETIILRLYRELGREDV